VKPYILERTLIEGLETVFLNTLIYDQRDD